ncbi:hypothetical protein GCM10010156_20550 [Planobispora rosea]|uniref:DUF4434 domain-containing protein n=1 Tax=Planobispora rosea TaxID=35762 RepID=A0A8J3S3N9_PLARO|nr:DUF4434 domain-containing protein [Planobispora rosea]GGS61747.1 hypothetical protein GCM10010156_20550 [Planobispora rosea]GIH86558.1 hypothetical protein Pro02_49660 [Planobispora rosea]
MRWFTALLGVAILAAVAAVMLVLPADDPAPSSDSSPIASPSAASSSTAAPTPAAATFTDPCGTFDTAVKAPYAVTGYWLIPTTDHCTWRRQFRAIHQVGGDTVIRIGWGLQARPVDEDGRVLKDGEVDSRYAPCEEDGVPCVTAAENDLKALNPGNRVSWTFVYRTDEAFGPGIFRCPEVEKKIEVDDTVFYRLIAPGDGSDDASCGNLSSQGRAYHVILIAAAKEDSLTELLDLGDQFGMKVFPALPLAPRDPGQSTRASERGVNTLTTLTRRILQDYGDRFQGRASLGGFYQPFELQMRDMVYSGADDPDEAAKDNPTLRVYASQHGIVEQVMPDKPILVSPYLEARKSKAFSATPKEVAAGFEALARTGVGIVAPQDSRGTGKVGLFWPDERDEPVDDRLRPVVGEGLSNGEAYHGSTRDYYREMAGARDRMAEQGYDVQLWANVEAFEPSGAEPCGTRTGTRGRTDKDRLDRAVTQVGRYVSKVVSYMWSDFFTCAAPGTPSLAEEIARDHDRPIPVDAVRLPRDIQDGIEIRGYNLSAESQATITWEGQETPRTVAVAGVGLEPPPPGTPAGMGTAWVPFDWGQVPEDTWVRIEITGPDGRRAAEPLHVRITL